MYEGIKLLYSLPANRVLISIAQGKCIYRFTLLTPDVTKQPFGMLVYFPKESRLDIYSQDNMLVPLV